MVFLVALNKKLLQQFVSNKDIIAKMKKRNKQVQLLWFGLPYTYEINFERALDKLGDKSNLSRSQVRYKNMN